jgi:lipoprotein-anchoring transpeptidase ErfK/SrfK
MEKSVMHRLGNVLAACAIVSSGCATDRYASTGTAYLNPFAGSGDNVSYWDGDEVVGQSSVKIDLVHQRAYFYKGDQLVGVSVVLTGREGYDTPSGEFRITQKDIDHASNLYGDYVDPIGHVVMRNVNIKLDPQPPGTTFRGAPRPYFLRVQGGIGMHAGYLPGYTASHGCIRLPKRMAVRFFQNAAVGTPVKIIKS